MNDLVIDIFDVKLLLSLDIDMSDATLYWYTDNDGSNPRILTKDVLGSELETHPELCTPTYSLQQIIEKLPERITKDGKTYVFCTQYHTNAGYRDETNINKPLILYVSDNLLHAVCCLLVWCKTNNYI